MIPTTNIGAATKTEHQIPNTALLAPLILAAVLRLANLGGRPLNPGEAQIALEGWRLWREAPFSLDGSPVLPNLLSLLFGAFGADDALARLPAAVAGTALVALPLVFGGHLGRQSALGACWLLALSPLLVLASRTLGGAMLGLLALAITLWAWQRRLDARDPYSLAALGAAIALGLGSTVAFIPWLLVVVVAALLTWGPERSGAPLKALSSHWPPVALGFGIVIALLHTRLLTVPSGLQTGLVDPLSRWPALLLSEVDARNLALLATAEAALLAAALAGLWLEARRGLKPLTRFLALWLVLALPLALWHRPSPAEALVFPLLPAALLGGRALGEAWDCVRASSLWRPLAFAAAASIPILYLAFGANKAARLGDSFPLIEALVAMVGMLLVALLFSGWLHPGDLRAGGIILASSLGLALMVAFIGRFSLSQAAVPPLPGDWTRAALRDVAAEAELWARQHPGEPLTIHPGPARSLAWALRDLPLIVVDEGAPARIAAARPQPDGQRRDAQAGLIRPIGASVQWGDRPDARGWWRWLVQGRDWVAPKPHGIILARSSE